MIKDLPRLKSLKICTNSEVLPSDRYVPKTVLGCHEVFNAIGESFSVTLMWIPGHTYLTGNAKADNLAKLGSDASSAQLR